MRLFEILIPITLSIYILWPFFTGKENPRLVNYLPVLAVVEVAAHLILEGYRWQMIPLYLFTGTILFIALPELRHPSTEEFEPMSWSAIGLIGIFIVLVTFTALPVLLPVPTLPAPNGRYDVGTQSFVLTDESRRELYSENDEPRKFMIKVWYPATPGPNDKHAPWMDHATVYSRSLANSLGLPGFFLDHLALVKSPAWQDAPVEPNSNGYPIILFSHSWNGFAAQNSGQALQLASNGYVVVALQHTYGAAVTVFPDGEAVHNKPSAFPDGAPESEYTQAGQKLVNQWSGDIAYAMDFLISENQEPASPFYSTLDLTKVGVYGHSTGGAAAIQFCGMDTRCKAVLAMDPLMVPISKQILNTGLSQTALYMFSQEWIDKKESANNRLFKKFFEKFKLPSHVIEIQGTIHSDFSDLPKLSPIAHQLGLKGQIDGKRVNEIINIYMYTFFSQTLNNYPIDLFSEPFANPDVITPDYLREIIFIQSLNEYPFDLFSEPLTYPEVTNLDYLREIIHPSRITLPRGQVYNLGKGKINNGKWEPLRAEWLTGTEISRWVALPWSSELETEIRGLKPGAQLELTMSNSDILVFKVSSIQNLTMEELLASDPTKPSLLVILFNNKDTNGTYLVITALPKDF